MSSLALMRLLENTPARYDAGMRALTLGRAALEREAAAEAAVPEACRGEASGSETSNPSDPGAPDCRVLEIGCGTGALSELLLARGAHVVGLDQSAAMLEQARARLSDVRAGRLALVEATASEIEDLDIGRIDAVVAAFVLSEMDRTERGYVLEAARRLLTATGRLVLADEVLPKRPLARMLWSAARLPQALAGWLLAGSVSRPLADLPAEVRHAGFHVRMRKRWLLGSLLLLVAEPDPKHPPRRGRHRPGPGHRRQHAEDAA